MKELYRQRREKLMEELPGPCLACVFSGRAPMRSLDEEYPFSVDRSFYYLTGLDRENMALVLEKDLSGRVSQALYIEPYDEYLAKWVGGRMRPEEARQASGVEAVRFWEQFSGDVNRFLDRSRGLGTVRVYLDLWRYKDGQADTPAHRLAAKVGREYPYALVGDVSGCLAALRSVKDQEELRRMERAQEVTRTALEAMMRHARPGINECELEGAFDFALMKQGVREHAFPSIVAGGARAATLHYTGNDQPVRDGELVLVDLGAAWEHYCADISRTFPVNGRFTPRQREIYETVLEAQRLVMDRARPGLTFRDLNDLVKDYYASRLEGLGLAQGGKTVDDYYYHSVSHSLGLDTHDLHTERQAVLRPGMVITVEPGLYIPQEGIGVRIEDDILITEDGMTDLSRGIPKTVEEIEALMSGRG